MKRFLFVVLMGMMASATNALEADFSQAQLKETSSQGLVLEGVQISDIQNVDATFVWNKHSNTLKLKKLDDGEDPVEFPTGWWTLSYDWQCDGSSSSAAFEMMENGQFRVEGYVGDWSLEGDQYQHVYRSGTTYSGVWDRANLVEGTMRTTGGSTGCFSLSFNEGLGIVTQKSSSDNGLDHSGKEVLSPVLD